MVTPAIKKADRADRKDTSKHALDDLLSATLKSLCGLEKEYVKSLQRNAENANRVYKAKKAVECISFRVNQSKPIIDEIDHVLAQHYGFTDEDLDFIVNYYIKYRMGWNGG